MTSDPLALRNKVKIAIAALLVVDIIAVILLFSPVVGSERSRREQMDQLWQELQRKTHEAEPLKNVDKKIAVASQQVDDFYKNRLPAQDSAIYDELGKVAKQSGVKIGQIRSKGKDTDAVGLRPVEIQADFSGDYLQLVRFINSLERDPLFFIIDSVELGGEQGGVVKLQLKLETYQKASV
jgi:type IV pilus assembly protein PilO